MRSRRVDLLSPNLIAHVSRQFQINPPGALYYPQRRPTRYEHVTRLKAYLGLRSFASEDSALAAEHARERIRSARVPTRC